MCYNLVKSPLNTNYPSFHPSLLVFSDPNVYNNNHDTINDDLWRRFVYDSSSFLKPKGSLNMFVDKALFMNISNTNENICSLVTGYRK